MFGVPGNGVAIGSRSGNWTALEVLGHDPPRLAVAALNPHGGEGGNFGEEEIKLIGPACEQARRFGRAVDGPIPAACRAAGGRPLPHGGRPPGVGRRPPTRLAPSGPARRWHRQAAAPTGSTSGAGAGGDGSEQRPSCRE